MMTVAPAPVSAPAPRLPAARFAALLALLLWTGCAGLGLATVRAVLGGSGSPAPLPVSGLVLVIALLTLFVAAVVVSFSRRYMRADRRPGAYFAGIALLVASVLLSVCASDLVTLAAGWLASGVLLARLIGHAHDWPEARQAAARTRRSFAPGDAALLAALALLGAATGSVRIDAVLAAVPGLPGWVTLPAALLLLVAAAARCALPPCAGWLLSSLTAPTPVSALMHAGLVNAGGVLLLRFAPLLEAAPAARLAAIALGLVAAVYGVGVMAVRPDVKRGLAGSTVSQMGFMVMSCGLGAYAAALWHIVAHGLFKAWLFLGSGSAIGRGAGSAAAPGETATVAGVALATLAAGVWLTLAPGATGGIVPLLLALATALVTLAEGWSAAIPLRARLAVCGLVAGLVGLHAVGIGAMHRLIGPDAAPLLPAWALIALLAAFLGGWVWQQHRRTLARPLPGPLYVRLLNAGASPTLAPAGTEI